MTTEMTMRSGGWTPAFDRYCLFAEQCAIGSRTMIHEMRQSTRDPEVRAEIESVVETLDEVAEYLSVGDVEMAVWMAQDVALEWQQFAVARIDDESVSDDDAYRWSRISNVLIEVEHKARYAMRVWINKGE